MIENLPLEYFKLVQDTRLFIQQKRGYSTFHDKEKPLLPLPLVIEKKKTESSLPPMVPQEPLTPLVKKPSPLPKKEVKQSTWQLYPMGPPETEAPFRRKLAQFTTLCDPVISVFLILEVEETEQRLFLENVSRAITRTLAPAAVFLYQESLFQVPGNKLFLIPHSLIKNRFPTALPHHPFKIENHTVLPLENLEAYGSDPLLKRSLWNAIQLLFQS